jgi:hypothetical protein
MAMPTAGDTAMESSLRTDRAQERPSETWGVFRPLVRAASRVKRRESGMITVAMTFRLCSPPWFRTVAPLKSEHFVGSGQAGRPLNLTVPQAAKYLDGPGMMAAATQ